MLGAVLFQLLHYPCIVYYEENLGSSMRITREKPKIDIKRARSREDISKIFNKRSIATSRDSNAIITIMKNDEC